MERGSREQLIEGLKIGFQAEFGSDRAPSQAGDRKKNKATKPAPTVRENNHQEATYVYGDGNTCMVGDLVECDGALAEVKTVASNGIVVDVPAEGMRIVGSEDLLSYKRVGSRRVKR